MRKLIASLLLLASPAFAFDVGSIDQVYQIPHSGTKKPGFRSLDLSKSGTVGSSILAVPNGGSGLATVTSNGIPYGQGASNLAVTSAGTQYQLFQAGGSGVPVFNSMDLSQSAAVGSSVLGFANGGSGAATLDQSYELRNLSVKGSATSNILTVAIKQKDGSTDCSNSAPCYIGFRSATITDGSYTQATITGSNSISLAAVDSIGVPNGATYSLNAYAILDGSVETCLSTKLFNEFELQSASALTGSADTDATLLWCPSAHTSKPIRSLGRVTATWSSPNWGSVALVTNTKPVTRSEWWAPTNSTCTSGTCTSLDHSQGISVAFSSTGTYTVSFTPNFTGFPSCVTSSMDRSTGSFCTSGAPTASGTTVICYVATTLTNDNPVVQCLGRQ